MKITGSAFITGASSGLGRALAARIAADGQPIAVTARREAELLSLVGEIEAAGGQAMAIPLDVADPDAVKAAVAQAEAALGPIGLMIANAGIDGLTPAEFSSRCFAASATLQRQSNAQPVPQSLPS